MEIHSRDSTAWRHVNELSNIHRDLLGELVARSGDRSILDFTFLSKYLSPVRNQGKTGACSHVSVIACTEMVYRIVGRGVNGLKGRFYFDSQDCFEHTYVNEELLHLQDIKERRADTMGNDIGTAVYYILRYLVRIGLLTNSSCINPQERNAALVFMRNTPNRNILPWYTQVARGNVISLLDAYPVIATIKAYQSLLACREVLYRATDEDRKNFAFKVAFHAVLLVGKFRLEEVQYVIIQNSHGVDFGFKGYVCVEFDRDLFTDEFWLPFDREVDLAKEMPEDQLKAITVRQET